jgi:DNA-binding beta-propeller fold protein YncE
LIIVGIWVLPQSSGSVAVDKIGGFKSPTRIASTVSGNIYVSDHKKGNVVILDSDGRKIGTIDGFLSPLGLAVHEIPPSIDCRKYKEKNKKDKCKDPIIGEGVTHVYVGDEGDGSVHIFTNGVETGLLGIGPGEFIKPNGIAVTSELIAYVVDSATNQVRIYDYQGNLQTAFGDAHLNFPTDIAINELAGEVYVSDYLNRRIAVFDLYGGWLREINAPENDSDEPIFLRPAGLGIDDNGNLYVVDNALSCVAIIDRWGELLETIGYRDGEYWTGELAVPVDAATANGRVYVTSNQQRQVKVFEVTP